MAPKPKISDEEKEAAKQAKLIEKANANLIKAAKGDKLKLAKESLDKGASLDVVNEKGHAVAHVAAAYGALNVIKLLFDSGADFTKQNAFERTPLQTAQHIGETKAARLIEALQNGESGDDIIKGSGDGSDDDSDDEADDGKKALDPEAAAKRWAEEKAAKEREEEERAAARAKARREEAEAEQAKAKAEQEAAEKAAAEKAAAAKEAKTNKTKLLSASSPRNKKKNADLPSWAPAAAIAAVAGLGLIILVKILSPSKSRRRA